jgi:hypothetical protein
MTAWMQLHPPAGHTWLTLLDQKPAPDLVAIHLLLHQGVLEAWRDDQGRLHVLTNPRAMRRFVQHAKAADLGDVAHEASPPGLRESGSLRPKRSRGPLPGPRSRPSRKGGAPVVGRVESKPKRT